VNTQQQPSVGDFLNNVQREKHEIAKRWWWFARGLQFIVLVVGVVVTIGNIFPTEFAILSAFLSIGSILALWASDQHKGSAQAIHRKFEFLDALGWDVSQRELRNLHISLPKGVKEKLDKSPMSPYDYFASKTPRSPRRLLENLTESTFYSQHLAMRSANIFGIMTIVTFALSLVFIVFILQSSPAQSTAIIAAKVFVLFLSFLFGGGFVRLAYDFYRFSQIAKHVEESACTLLKQADADIEKNEVVKLYQEYQLVRAGSPLIPSFVYNAMRDELNKLWSQYEQCKPAQSP